MRTKKKQIREELQIKLKTLEEIRITLQKKSGPSILSIEDFVFLKDTEIRHGLDWFDTVYADSLTPLYKWWNQQTLEYWENMIAFGISLPELNELYRLYKSATRPFRSKNRPVLFRKERPKDVKSKSKTRNKSKASSSRSRTAKVKRSHTKSSRVHKASNK